MKLPMALAGAAIVAGLIGYTAGYSAGDDSSDSYWQMTIERDKFDQYVRLKNLQEWAWRHGVGYTLSDVIMRDCAKRTDNCTAEKMNGIHREALNYAMSQQSKLMLGDDALMEYIDGNHILSTTFD